MSGPSSRPQTLLLIDSPDRGMRLDASWLFSLLLHAMVIGIAVWLWSAERVIAPQLQIDVALVDGDLSSVTGQPIPEAAPQDTSKEPAKEPIEDRPVIRNERKPVPISRATPVLERHQTDARPEPQKVMPETSRPEPPPTPAETAPPSPEVALSDAPTTEPVPLPAAPAAPPATEEATQEPHLLPEPPTPPMTAHLPPSEARLPAPESNPSHESNATQPETTVPSLADARSHQASRADYGWLAEALWIRVEKGKRYPQQARLNQWEGKVVVRAVIRDDGQLVDLDVARSSGHSVLDADAMASVRQAFPLRLPRSLGTSQVALQIPINYQLDR